MPLLTVSDTLNSPIARVWDIVGDFGGLPRWSGAVSACVLEGSGVGSHRVVSIGASQVRERLEIYDAHAHFIQYRPVSGSTLPITDALMSMRLTALDADRTRLDWVIDGHPTAPEADVVERLRTRYAARIVELRAALLIDIRGFELYL